MRYISDEEERASPQQTRRSPRTVRMGRISSLKKPLVPSAAQRAPRTHYYVLQPKRLEEEARALAQDVERAQDELMHARARELVSVAILQLPC